MVVAGNGSNTYQYIHHNKLILLHMHCGEVREGPGLRSSGCDEIGQDLDRENEINIYNHVDPND